MDKKSIVVLGVLGIILLVIIGAVFIYDGKINTNIVEVNGEKYSKSDFESYVKVWQYQNGSTPVDMETIFSNYQVYKLYSQYLEKYDVELPSGEQVPALTDAEKTKLEQDYNLSESEYMRVKTEIAEIDYLFANLQKYWVVSEEEYNTHKEGNEDKFKMYDYRVMQVAVDPAPEKSGDGSGDNSGDTSGDTSEQARKDAAKSKAVIALAKVKSGDKFEDVAKEYGTTRITYTNGGYSIVNGNLESISGLYMDSYLWDANIIKALQTLKPGEYSEIYESESSYVFVYLENIREGLDEADKNSFKRQIANEHIQSSAVIVPNRITFKSVKLNELVPALLKSGDSVTEEHDHDHDHSFEVEIESGEQVSGEVSGEANQ